MYIASFLYLSGHKRKIQKLSNNFNWIIRLLCHWKVNEDIPAGNTPCSTNWAIPTVHLLCSNNRMAIIKSENYFRAGTNGSDHFINNHLISYGRKLIPSKVNQLAHRWPQSQANLMSSLLPFCRLAATNCQSCLILKHSYIKIDVIYKTKCPTLTDGWMV